MWKNKRQDLVILINLMLFVWPLDWRDRGGGVVFFQAGWPTGTTSRPVVELVHHTRKCLVIWTWIFSFQTSIFLFLTSKGHVADCADVPHYFLQLRKVKNFWEDASGFLGKSPEETVSSAKLNLKEFLAGSQISWNNPLCVGEWHRSIPSRPIPVRSSLCPVEDAGPIWSRFSFDHYLLKSSKAEDLVDKQTKSIMKNKLTRSMAMSVSVFGSTISPWSSTRGTFWREWMVTLVN